MNYDPNKEDRILAAIVVFLCVISSTVIAVLLFQLLG